MGWAFECVFVCVLLFLHAMLTRGEVMKNYPGDFSTINNVYCGFGPMQKNYYNEFISAMVTNKSFDPVNGWSMKLWETCNAGKSPEDCIQLESHYYSEAVRFIPSTTCTYCPYHLDPVFNQTGQYDNSASWGEPRPMFGPCLDGQPSKRMVCLQHHALAPQKLLGSYYYPTQKALSLDVISFSDPFPIHMYLKESITSSPYEYINGTRNNRPPTDYGLGKGAVTAWLDKLAFKFKNGSTDEVSTANMKSPYVKVNEVEQWMKYAQYWCEPGCHKTDRASYFLLRPQDIAEDLELSYLSYYQINNIDVFACRPCPMYSASYRWNEGFGPYDPRENIVAPQCFPWFGAIPSMKPYEDSSGKYYLMNMTEKDNINSKVHFPLKDFDVFPIVCPVNTFNRVCAHTKESIYSNAMTSSPPASLQKYDCTPCPPGYHTAGSMGQWYCSPPPGRLFQNRESLQKYPNLWGNRTFMSYKGLPELECGPYPENCLQCNYYKVGIMTPEVFNEKYVFSKILEEVNCSSGRYCPDTFSDIACPPELPWSPPGSGFLTNCTCARQTYWNGSVCLPCTFTCEGMLGYYLPRSQCMQKDGATQDAPCTRCTNIPMERAVANGVGVELRSGGGTCPYQCIFGSEMDQSRGETGKSICEQVFACKPVVPRKKALSNKYTYKESLDPLVHIDRVILTEDRCQVMKPFSNQIAQIDLLEGGWLEHPTSCKWACSQSAICYAENQSQPLIDPKIPWYSLSARTNCTQCPGLRSIPSQEVFLRDVDSSNVLLGSALCQDPKLFCNDTHYFNQTVWACQSCSARESAICPPMNKLRAGGCMNRYEPFNSSDPSADCQRCPLNIPNLNESRGILYLNYLNASGCSLDNCDRLTSGFFWKTPCGADVSGVQAWCTIDCPGYQYRESPCSDYANLVCKNCTARKPGFIKVENCSVGSDSVWEECPRGYYCDSSGRTRACPPNKTSLPGTSVETDCFCVAGMQETVVNGGCEPYQCPDTVISISLPGKSLVSSHYMTTDPLTRSTICLPCNSQTNGGAYTRGKGVEIESCTCPPGSYGVYPNSSKLSIQCTPCPSSSQCLGAGKLLLSCAQGDLKVMVGESFPCACAVAPFTVPPTAGSTCPTSSSCASGFDATGRARPNNRGIPQISGSSLYAANKSSTAVFKPTTWKRLLATTNSNSQDSNNNIQAFAISGCMDDSILGNSVELQSQQSSVQAYHFEYIFWLVADTYLPTIHASLLTTTTGTVNPDTHVSPWTVDFGSSFSTAHSLIGIATSKWTLVNPAQPYTNANRVPWLYVGVLLKDSTHEQGLFYMKVRVFNTTDNLLGSPGVWRQQVYNVTLFQGQASSSRTDYKPVGMAHCTKKMGEANPPLHEEGYFYISFNTQGQRCGGVLVTRLTSSANPLMIDWFCDASFSITAMAITLTPTSLTPSILLALSSGNVLKVESTTAPPSGIASSNSLFTSAQASPFLIHNMIILFSLNTPVYVSGVHSEAICGASYGFNCLQTADSSEMRWVDLQGMPWGSAVNSLPMSLAASVISNSEALLVTSSGGSLFTLSINRCFSLNNPNNAQYWDGVGCTDHSCIKETACKANAVRNEVKVCVCKNGYYAGSSFSSNAACQQCNLPKYCEEEREKQCPDGTATQVVASESINKCICPSLGQFFSTAVLQDKKCINCPTGNAWCPNQWLSLPCPGGKKQWGPQLTLDGLTTPVQCLCAAGYTGPGCTLCPSGFYCPDTGTSSATNLAVYYTFEQAPLTTLVVSQIQAFFAGFFANQATKPPNYSPDALDRILYTEAVPITNRTKFGIVVMIQIESSSAAAFNTWPVPLYNFLTARQINVSGRVPTTNIPYSSVVQGNKPLQCSDTKVPNNFPSSCVCAPGYESKGEQCAACPVNTHKSTAGVGSCTACPIGKVSAIKSSECKLDPTLSTTTTTQNAAGPDVALLAGGIGGGVVGLLLLIFVMQYFLKHTHRD